MEKTVVKQRIKAYLDLIRPFTLLAPIIVSTCIMIASFVYNDGTGNLFTICWTTIVPASFALAILNGASNALNQITDLEGDKISKPYRPIPRGDIAIKQALVVSISMYVVAILLSLIVNPMFIIFIFLIVSFTITYSIGNTKRAFRYTCIMECFWKCYSTIADCNWPYCNVIFNWRINYKRYYR